MKNINEIISNNLEKMQNQNIVIIQEGFIEGKYSIEKAKCKIEEEILCIEDNNNYLRINLNQIYNIETKQDGITMYLDNDIKVIIKY